MQTIKKVGASLIKTSLSMSESCEKSNGKFIRLIIYYVNYSEFPPTTFYNRETVNVV
jgi:hypothetical protein